MKLNKPFTTLFKELKRLDPDWFFYVVAFVSFIPVFLLFQGFNKVKSDFSAPEVIEPLSKKEKEVLGLMASGYSNKEISLALHKSEGTIKNHVSNLLAKLGVRDRTRAVLLAIEKGLL